MDTTTDPIADELHAAEQRRWRLIIMAGAAAVVAVLVVFQLTQVDAADGPVDQRVVVQTDGEPLTLLGGLAYAGFVEFEVSTEHPGAVERIMKPNEEPDVVASEIERTFGDSTRIWVEDAG